jgi:hypothetical protein
MRIALPVVVLLFGASSARAQIGTSEPVAETRAEAVVPPVPVVPAQAPVQPLRAAATTPALQEQPTAQRAPAPAEAAAVGRARQEEPKRRSRVVWFLVGAVAVLGIIVATSL